LKTAGNGNNGTKLQGVENARHEYSGKEEYRKPLLRNEILTGAKFTLRPPSLALSYWQRYCTAVEQWANFVALTTGLHLYVAGRPSC